MKKLRTFLMRIAGTSRREQRDREFAAELESHLQMHIEDNLRHGMTPAEARRQALMKLGGVEQTKEAYRERRGLPFFEAFFQDVRFGGRQLGKNPGFTAVAALTLALGIGANTAIFSLVDGILLRPLPYPQPERLVVYLQSYPSIGLDRWGISQFLFASFREQAHSFERSAAHVGTDLTLIGFEEPVRLQGARVTAGFFEVLGVQPARGRVFLPEEDVVGKNIVCILSDRLWHTRFGSDPNVVGKSLRLNDALLQVIGVMPPGFQFPSPETDLWIPLGLDPQRRFGFMFTGIARLKDGVTATQAEAEMTGIQWNLARQTENPPPPGADLRMIVTPLHEATTQGAKRPLLVLLGAVGLVLLIACANISNLLLGRVTARKREIALRIALGASARRVVAQLLTESLLLALLGGVAGAVFSAWLVALIGLLPLEGIPRIAEVQVNTTALLFTAAVALATGFLFGLAPAVRAYQLGLGAGLREGIRSTSSVSSRRLNSSLVAAQVALSLVLLIGAGLLLKSFAHLLAVNPGFQTDSVLTLRVALSGPRYNEREPTAHFYEMLIERVRSLPGVRAVGLTSSLPIQSDGWSDGYVVEGQQTSGPVQPNALLRLAFPGYFQTLGIPLRGRDFSNMDRGDTEPVAIVDETLARLHWPNGDAIGKRIRIGWDTSDRAWMTIVGVAGDVKHSGLESFGYPHLYMPFRQPQDTSQEMYLVIRTSSAAAAIIAATRAQVHELDSNVPLFAMRNMSEIVAESLNSQRLTNILLGSFAGVALLLAAVGIYGVMSLSVAGCTQEFGIRMALGAQRGDVFRLVVGKGMGITAAGMVVGVLGALGVTRYLQTLLFEVSPIDPVTFVGVAVVLGSAAFAASYLPARRAARVDPMVALRYE